MIDRTVIRAKPWFGQYLLCGKMLLPEASALRGLDHKHIDRCVISRRRWATIKINHGGSWRDPGMKTVVSDQQQQDLHDICDFFLTQKQNHKLCVATNSLYVYTNDRFFLERLTRFPVGIMTEIAEIKLEGDPDAVNLKRSEHSFRSYFRAQNMDDHLRRSLKCYLEQQDLRIGPALKWALDNQFQKLHDYHFVDHNDQGVLTMLALIHPGLVRQTVPISVAK